MPQSSTPSTNPNTLPNADPIDRVSDALLTFVRASMPGTIPRAEVNFTRSPTDLPGTTPDNEWLITLTISAIERLDDDASPVFKFRQEFSAVGSSKEQGISGIVTAVRDFLTGEIRLRESELFAAREALRWVDEMPVLDTMWSDKDPQEGEEPVTAASTQTDDVMPDSR